MKYYIRYNKKVIGMMGVVYPFSFPPKQQANNRGVLPPDTRTGSSQPDKKSFYELPSHMQIPPVSSFGQSGKIAEITTRELEEMVFSHFVHSVNVTHPPRV